MPELLAFGRYPDQIDWHYLAVSCIDGQAIREVRPLMTAEDRLAVARELGWTIRRLHQTPLEEARVLVSKREQWLAFLGRRRKECLFELRDKTNLPLEVLEDIARFLTPGQLVPSRNLQLKLLNGDFTEDHLLLVKRLGEWRMSGLIDWADALVGVREYEWVALWFGLCGQEVEMFREVLTAYEPEIRLDNAFRRRMMAYTLIHRFGPEIIGHMLRKQGAPAVRSLVELQTWLWPPMMSI
jgi:hygromycin-B 7''-O-kinase